MQRIKTELEKCAEMMSFLGCDFQQPDGWSKEDEHKALDWLLMFNDTYTVIFSDFMREPHTNADFWNHVKMTGYGKRSPLGKLPIVVKFRDFMNRLDKRVKSKRVPACLRVVSHATNETTS